MYTEEQREALNKIFNFTDFQIDLLEEAYTLGDSIPAAAFHAEGSPEAVACAEKIEKFLKERGLYEEVGETLNLIASGITKRELREKRPLGACLVLCLKLIE